MLRKATAVRDFLLNEVTAGRFKPGMALPPEVELAEELGVSRQTVRKALAEMDDEGIIRREQGRGTFVSKDAHRQLRQEVNSFGLLVVRILPAALPMLCGFQQACQSAQGNAVLYDSGNNLDTQANIILGILHGGSPLSGLAMLPTTTPPMTPAYHVTALQERGIPVVLCHRGVPGANAPLLALPYEEMGRMAGSAAARHGHRRAALICSHPSLLLDLQIRGFREALRANGCELPDRFVYEGQSVSLEPADRDAQVAEGVERIFGAQERPTVVYVASGQDAESAYGALQRLGLRVPEDVSLLTTTVEPNPHEQFLRTVASVFVPEAEIGRRAFEILCEMRSGKRPIDDTETIVMPIHWREGRTLGPAP
jgi:GntR family transcriptional regulator, arabinose operon transcriptional repressor